jgi:hypothetical protein
MEVVSQYSDWLRAGRPRGRSSSPGTAKIFLLSTASRPVLGPIQPIQWVPGAHSPGLKRPGLEADYSPPTSAEVKNMWIYTSTPPYAFMAQCLVKHRDNFTFISQLHAPAALLPEKQPTVSREQEAGWAPESVWALWRRQKKISCSWQESNLDSYVVEFERYFANYQ